jgi:YesN/AraC family two-component response regulator
MKEKIDSMVDLIAAYNQLPKVFIDDDFIMVDSIHSVPLFDFPYKAESTIVTICLAGTVKGTINLKDCSFSKNDFVVLLPGQIIQYTHISDDFSSLIAIMSKRFTDNLSLSIKDSALIFHHLKENPVISLNSEELSIMLEYYSILRKMTKMKQNPHRMEIIKLLAQAFFYATTDFYQYRQSETIQKSRKEQLFDTFYDTLLIHYKESREVIFYANKLCITPKYFSVIIKEVTGKSAYEWINDYVILEAKSSLKITNKSIQEISNDLGFPNQSFFGKYFKHHTGVSPKEYRNL